MRNEMPPLPEPALIAYHDPGAGEYYTADQLRAYGEACRQEERERNAALIRKCSDNGRRPGFTELAARIAGERRCVGPECQGCMECDTD